MVCVIPGMQNSAASCFIVSLIDLAAAAAVGTFAIIQKQVSACMVTGVLYCMAGKSKPSNTCLLLYRKPSICVILFFFLSNTANGSVRKSSFLVYQLVELQSLGPQTMT